IEAHDRCIRAARCGALRHQEIERAERRLKAYPRTGLFIEEFLIGDDLGRVGIAFGSRKDDSSDRLRRTAAARPGNPGDRDGNVRFRSRERSARHCPGGGDADGAEGLDDFFGYLELADLGRVRIGHIARFEHLRRSRNFGQSRADETSGAALRDCHLAAGGAVRFDDFTRLVHQLLGQESVVQRQNPIRMLATAWTAIPSPRPVNPSPSVVVALMLTWLMLNPAISAMRSRIAGRCGPILGASAAIVQSTWSIIAPARRKSSTAWARKIEEFAPLQRASDGGKCSPMSPRPA